VTLHDRLPTSRRKAQFFIITVVLVAGSLSITVNVIDDHKNIPLGTITSSSSPYQFATVTRNADKTWFETEWDYRKGIIVQERSGIDISSYPVSVDIDSRTLIQQGKMEGNCADLRIVHNGEELPHQIERGDCNTTATTVWFPVTLNENETERLFAYYGNNKTGAPSYDTDLDVDEQTGSFDNSVIKLTTGNSSSGNVGFVEGRRVGSRNFIQQETMLYKGPPGTSIDVVEKGPVYATINFGGDQNFTLFAENQFVRKEGPQTVDSSSAFYYADDTSRLSSWEAGSDGNNKSVGGTWSGSMNPDSPYIAAMDYESGDTLMALTNTRATSSDIDRYTAEDNATGHFMGFGPASGSTTLPYIDYYLGSNYTPDDAIGLHSNPPRVIKGVEETGRYFPADGWDTKRRIGIEERYGRHLDQFPVNITLNTGRLTERDDCNDIVFIRNEKSLPYILRDQCDSEAFNEPDTFTVRWPLDDGRGNVTNDTQSLFNADLQGSPPPSWSPGRYGFALKFDGQNYIESGPPPRIELQNSSFSISLWFRADFQQQDHSSPTRLLHYPLDTPSFEAVNNSGNIVLQGRFRDTQDNLHTVNGSTDLRTLSDNWHHAVFSYSRYQDRMALHLDGEQIASAPTQRHLMFASDTIRIGEGLNGSIDEVKVYKRRLSDDKIRDQYISDTQLTFLTDLPAATTDKELAVYGSSSAGLKPYRGGKEQKIEAGQVVLSNTIDAGVQRTVNTTFDYRNPVVVAYIQTRDDNESIDARVTNVRSDSFTLFMENPRNRTHGSEVVSYFVAEEGSYRLPDGTQFEAGVHETSSVHRGFSPPEDYDGDRIDFRSNFNGPPAVMATLNTYNNSMFMSTAISQGNGACSSKSCRPTADYFGLEQEAAQTEHIARQEQIGWMAIENTGAGSIFRIPYEVGIVDDTSGGGSVSPVTINYNQSFGSTPIIGVHGQSGNDREGYWARGYEPHNAGKHNTYAEEDQAQNSDRANSEEFFGYWALERPFAIETVNGEWAQRFRFTNITNSSKHPDAEIISGRLAYDNEIGKLSSHIRQVPQIQTRIQFDIKQHCSTIRFSGGTFRLQKQVC